MAFQLKRGKPAARELSHLVAKDANNRRLPTVACLPNAVAQDHAGRGTLEVLVISERAAEEGGHAQQPERAGRHDAGPLR
jgi:hypothetical protein